MSSRNPNIQTAIDMKAAREAISIDVKVIGAFLRGSEEQWQKRQQIIATISSDPIFNKSQRNFLSREELFKRALSLQNRVDELRVKHGWSAMETSIATHACDEQLPINLHSVAFQPVVFSQGSYELIATYGALIQNRGILGCYLQTELGHGTNVAQLETTATYLPKSEEFEIHSPTLTSTKWWVGNLGKTATHGVVQARLILPDGKDVGPHLFFVQLRSLEDHKVLQGISIGDIGPKALGGFAGVDNGFAKFDRVRIPRFHMLSKFAQVTRDGKYVRPPHSKLSYGGMLYIRSTMVSSAGEHLAKAATISIRYATVRRQGNQGSDGLERQVISYPSVYRRLLPILSRSYTYILLGRKLANDFQELSSQLAKGDTSLLADMHAVTSGLKVLVSTATATDLEAARRSMGGHGFSAFAGIGRLYADYLPATTYEGDNFVLDQQVVRAALKAYKVHAASSQANSSTFAFLRFLTSNPTATSPSPSSKGFWDNPRNIILLLEQRASKVVEARARSEAVDNAFSDQVISRAVTDAFVAVQVGHIIDGLRFLKRETEVLTHLFKLYLLVSAEEALQDLLAFNLVNMSNTVPDPRNPLYSAIKETCEAILPEAVGLTDAFGYTDWELDSALGVYDGRVYEALFERAQTEPLNQKEVTEGYEEYIKPMLQRGQQLVSKSAKL